MDPASIPSRGCIPVAYERTTATTFWRSTSTEATIKKIKTCGPPCFSILKLAARPMLVKNVIIRGSLTTMSKLKEKLSLSAQLASAKITPPITGAGILYLLRKKILFRRNMPSQRLAVAKATVSTRLKLSSVIVYTSPVRGRRRRLPRSDLQFLNFLE